MGCIKPAFCARQPPSRVVDERSMTPAQKADLEVKVSTLSRPSRVPHTAQSSDRRGCYLPPARSDTERIAGERVERCSRHYRAVVMTDREALVLLARSVADAAPASMNEVAELEGQLVSSTTICRASRT